jgi:hypothetical protein
MNTHHTRITPSITHSGLILSTFAVQAHIYDLFRRFIYVRVYTLPMQGPQKVPLIKGVLHVPSNVPENEKESVKRFFIGIIVWFAVDLIVATISAFVTTGELNVWVWISLIVGLAISAACCFCFIEGINGQNKTLIRVFSVCNVLGFVCIMIGVITSISASAATVKACNKCIEKNVTACTIQQRRGVVGSGESVKLKTSDGCHVYDINPGSVVWGLVSACITFGIALSGFKVASYNIIFTKQIHPHQQMGFVAAQPVVIQPNGGIVSGHPVVVQSGPPIVVRQVSGIPTNNAQQQQGAANIQMVQNGGYVMPTIQTNTGLNNSNGMAVNNSIIMQQPPPPPPTKTNV